VLKPIKTYTIEEAKRALERYCVYQDRCHQEVRKKLLEMRMIPDAIDIVIGHLIEHNFLNEERFAQSFARGKFRIKSWGKQRIVRELKFRDISTYNIKTALKEIKEDEYIATIYRITENRNAVISEPNQYKRKKKLVDYLMRKGFENELIFKVVEETIQTSSKK